MLLYKDIYLCGNANKFIPINFNNIYYNWFGVDDISDPQFTPVLSNSGSLMGYTFNETTPGIYTAEIQVKKDNNSGGIIANLTIKVHLSNECFATTTTCCAGQFIVWLNNIGGIESFFFNGKFAEYNVQQSGVTDYIDYLNIKRFNQKRFVYSGRVLTTGSITKEQADVLDGLKTSIQAWELTAGDDNETIVTPIFIKADNFKKYKKMDKFYDVTIDFIYAKPINIQTT